SSDVCAACTLAICFSISSFDIPSGRRRYTWWLSFTLTQSSRAPSGASDLTDAYETSTVNGKSVLGGKSSTTPVILHSTLCCTWTILLTGSSSPKYFLAMLRVRTMLKGSSSAVSGLPASHLKSVSAKSKTLKKEGSTMPNPESSMNFFSVSPLASSTSTRAPPSYSTATMSFNPGISSRNASCTGKETPGRN